MPARSLMLMGTGSDVGKSVLVAGLARAFTRHGVRVLPFKPQNMSNNAAVTIDGGEIGRAQWLQSIAARAEPSIHMNPVLLKPQSETGAQIVVHGKVVGQAEAGTYQAMKPSLMAAVMESFDTLRSDCDLVLVEGAGSPAEVNLRAGDIANMGFALPTGVPVVLVGDINRGGVIASIIGTHTLLPQDERALIKGFIINQFRGDMRLFDGGIRRIEDDTGWQSYGIVPFLRSVRELPAEDAVVLDRAEHTSGKNFVIAVPLLPRISNFDDLDPLKAEPGVDVVFCPPGTPLPRGADLIILPGSKATISDLRFLKAEGWDIDIAAHVRAGGAVLGICGGYQMLGQIVADTDGIEGPTDHEEGLGHLDIETSLKPEKTVTSSTARVMDMECTVSGYEIHTGETVSVGSVSSFMEARGTIIGHRHNSKPIWGTYMHGLFEDGTFRKNFMAELGVKVTERRHSVHINASLDSFADSLNMHLNLGAILEMAR